MKSLLRILLFFLLANPVFAAQVISPGGQSPETVVGSGTFGRVLTDTDCIDADVATANQAKLHSRARVNAQTGTTYTVVDGDRCKLVTFSNASPNATTLPQAGSASQFLDGWYADFQNRGAGTVTITPTTSTIDGAASLALTQNQGVRIFSDGTNYFTQRGVTSITLDQAFDQGKIIDGANSLANAVRIGDGTTPGCIYTDATDGFRIRPCTASDIKTIILTNFDWHLWDEEAAASILKVDPDAATTRAMYTFGTAYKPKKSVWIPAGALFGDGTQCPAAPSTVTINSGAPRQTFICTNNDASSLYGEVSMPKSWDGGSITVAHHYIQTAADTGVLNGDVAASCRLAGATINNTWGTEVAIDDVAVSGSNILDITESAAVTPNGTCTAGMSRLLQIRYQVDAIGTTTAVATLHHMGFMIEYSVTSLSD